MIYILYTAKLLAASAVLFGIPGFFLGGGVTRFRSGSFSVFLFGSFLGIAVVTQLFELISLLTGFGLYAIAAGWALSCLLGWVQCRRWGAAGRSARDMAVRECIPWPPPAVCVFAVILSLLMFAANITVFTGHGVYFPYFYRDIFVRYEVVQAVLDTGIPPLNTFINLGPQKVMAYQPYYFEACAALAKMTGVPVWFAYPFWVAVSTLPFLAAGFAVGHRYFRSSAGAMLCFILLFCGGFDLVIIAIQTLREWLLLGIPLHLADIDFWAGTPQIPLLVRLMVSGPHHTFAAGLSLCLVLLMDRSLGRDWSVAFVIICGVALASIAGLSTPTLLSAAAALAFLTACYCYSRDLSAGLMVVCVCAVGVLLASPLLYQVLQSSSQNHIRLGLLMPEYGAVFSSLFGNGFIQRVLDVVVYMFLELGILPILAAAGVVVALRRRLSLDLTAALVGFGLSSLLIVLFLRGPGELFPATAVVPFKIFLAVFSAVWVTFVFERRSWAGWLRQSIVFCLFIQLLATAYSIAVDAGARYLPTQREAAQQHLADLKIMSQVDSRMPEGPYRVQAFPPKIALSNTLISALLPVFFPRAHPLFVNDAGLYLGFDVGPVQQYMEGLCTIYGGNGVQLARELSEFDFESAMQTSKGNPWGPFIRSAMRCVPRNGTVDMDAFAAFVARYRLDAVLIDPIDKAMLAALPSIEKMPSVTVSDLDRGFVLVRFQR